MNTLGVDRQAPVIPFFGVAAKTAAPREQTRPGALAADTGPVAQPVKTRRRIRFAPPREEA